VKLEKSSDEPLTLPKHPVLGTSENPTRPPRKNKNEKELEERNVDLQFKISDFSREIEHLKVLVQDLLRAKGSESNPSRNQRTGNLKSAYSSVCIANRKSQEANKKRYDRRAKHRQFKPGKFAYLYNPAKKPGLTKKFYKPWQGPCQVTRKISGLNYEIADRSGKRQIVNINRFKRAYNFESWIPQTK
jgi:hypothetical protein